MGKKYNKKWRLNKKFKLFLMSLMVIGIVIKIIPPTYAASSGTLTFGGSSTVTTGQEFTVDISAINITGSNLMGAQGTVTSSDPSCISFQKLTRVSPTNVNNNIFAYADTEGNASTFTVAKATFKAGSSACKTNINITGTKVSFTDGTKLTIGTISKEITVGEATPEPPKEDKSNDATLKNLTVDKGTLSPKFSSGTTSYNVEVDSDVTSITLTATKNHAKATISGGGNCKLNATGKTACSVKVTAEDGTVKTYTVNVTKKASGATNPSKDDPKPDDPTTPDEPAKSNDTSLKSLEVVGQNLTPSFSEDEDSYVIKIPNNVNDLKLNAIANNPKATVTITGANNLIEGVNPIKIIVKAEDGTTRIYVVNAVKEGASNGSSNSGDGSSSSGGSTKKSSDNFLKDIIATNGDLSPSFNSSTSSYSIIVPNEITSLDLKAIVNDSKARVNISGNDNFKVGLNVVTIEVQAEDGSLRIYTINVTRSDKSGETKLKDLSVGGKTLFPTFNPDMYEYTVDVDNNVDKLDISAIPISNDSKVEIIGNDNLKEGNNTVLVKVTDKNGFVQYYRLNVKKSAKKKFLGLPLGWWLAILGLLLLLGFIIILFLLFRRKKDDKEDNEKTIIEFKPEINIGSKNGTDDDYIESGGTMNQFAGSIPQGANKVIEEAEVKEIPYDLYDDIVTKDELFDALKEANEKKDNSKLRMLYEQEMLNRKKEELRKKENRNDVNPN